MFMSTTWSTKEIVQPVMRTKLVSVWDGSKQAYSFPVGMKPKRCVCASTVPGVSESPANSARHMETEDTFVRPQLMARPKA